MGTKITATAQASTEFSPLDISIVQRPSGRKLVVADPDRGVTPAEQPLDDSDLLPVIHIRIPVDSPIQAKANAKALEVSLAPVTYYVKVCRAAAQGQLAVPTIGMQLGGGRVIAGQAASSEMAMYTLA